MILLAYFFSRHFEQYNIPLHGQSSGSGGRLGKAGERNVLLKRNIGAD